MGAAPLAYVLWDRFLKHNPRSPAWPDRDRFVLSAGHASMLLYSLLYLTGYDLSLDDLKNFRQWGSKTPGHPEYGLTPGVETTSGPLGQGFANGVGMAMAERHLAGIYNRPGFNIIDHYTYALVSDGDIEEGISSEAASLAGALKLGKLIYLYDKNEVQQDGPTNVSFREDVAQRFLAYGWNVIGPIDGMDPGSVNAAILSAQGQSQKPNLIICRTVIGYGSPHKAGTNAAHGEPLGEEEVRLTREKLGWPYPQTFFVPPPVLAHFRQAVDRGKAREAVWQELMKNYRQAFPSEAAQLEADLKGELPVGWDTGFSDLFRESVKPLATRDASGQIMNLAGGRIPSLAGGAADLAGSTRASLKGLGDFDYGDYRGRNFHFGLREHAMGAITNGMALHGGIIPFAGTFLIFSDYMRPAVRLAAIMKLHIVYIFTHDSIGLGEDGPTHQPIEHLMSLRAMPDLLLLRPADATETVEAWKLALERQEGPTALVLTRQNLPVLDRKILAPAGGVQKGGYILLEPKAAPQVILIGTGSEVHIALAAAGILEEKGIAARVVSLPSWSLFDSQTKEYRDSVLPPQIRARVSIEAGSPIGWEHYVGSEGTAIGLSRFGASAPANILYQQFGLTAERMAQEALKLVNK